MAKSVLILGSSGAGKSTAIGRNDELAIEGLDPSETIIISSLGKELPWKGSGKQYTIWNKELNPKGNMIVTSYPKSVLNWLHHINKNMPAIKNIVLDDNTHNSSMEYMRRMNEKTYDKFNDIADFMSRTALEIKTFREDLTVFVLHHTRISGDGILEPKKIEAMTIGKLVDEKLSGYESFFTVVLRAEKKTENDKVQYVFLTEESDATTKSPYGMFPSKEIKNDLGYVKKAIKCYYEDDCK